MTEDTQAESNEPSEGEQAPPEAEQEGSLGVAKTQAQIDQSNAEDVARTQAEAEGSA